MTVVSVQRSKNRPLLISSPLSSTSSSSMTMTKRVWVLRALIAGMAITATYFLRVSELFLLRHHQHERQHEQQQQPLSRDTATGSASIRVLGKDTDYNCQDGKTLNGWLCESKKHQQQLKQQHQQQQQQEQQRQQQQQQQDGGGGFGDAAKRDSKQQRQEQDQEGLDNKQQQEQHKNENNINNNSVNDKKRSGCFRYNTDAWLNNPRLGNINETLMDDEYIRRTILDAPSLLSIDEGNHRAAKGAIATGATLCPDTSRFRNLYESGHDSESIRLWTVRLVYLAFHYHQHRYAIPEAQIRIGDKDDAGAGCTRTELGSKSIGRYDYECPDAKYLVIALNENGLGANLRVVIIRGLLAGLISNRIVLFVNNSPTGHYLVRGPWKLASCERRDYQCFFLPTTPCVVTQDDMHNAYSLSKSENRNLFRRNEFPQGHEDDKVWRTQFGVPARDIPMIAANLLRNHSLYLIERGVPSNDPRRPTLLQAADEILNVGESGSNRAPILIGLMMYAMRPNLYYATQMNEIYDEITQGVNADYSIGLPIRASDKCGSESECLSFRDHLTVVNDLMMKHKDIWTNQTSHLPIDPTIVFTTESKMMVKEQEDFVRNATAMASIPFHFRVATNTRDITPDTGFITKKDSFSRDDQMLSAVSTIKFQLTSRMSIGNCCSHFHVLLQNLLAGGCSAAKTGEHIFHCMQDNEDPYLRLCCTWDQQCLKEKEEALQQRKQMQIEANGDMKTER